MRPEFLPQALGHLHAQSQWIANVHSITTMTDFAILTENLRRVFKSTTPTRRAKPEEPREFTALDGISLEVRPGELFGLLGSNGAGKTTLIKILATLLAPSGGRAFVDGLDVVTQAPALRPRINMVSGGETAGYGVLTVRENLWLFSQLYGIPRKEARNRIEALLAATGLADKADTRITHLSTGQRQKMNFCRGFVTNPRILFLDEPTLGLDVTAARTARQFVRGWMDEAPGRTMLLTTHYMMEAEELCDRLAIVDKGKLLACDTPSALKRRVQRYTIFEMALSPGPNGWHELSRLPGVHQCSFTEGQTSVDLRISLHEEAAVGAVVQEVLSAGSRILALKKVEPTMEDAFVELVGHDIAAAEVDQ
jgi:ABC-2 type transport system ATP-binding protein